MLLQEETYTKLTLSKLDNSVVLPRSLARIFSYRCYVTTGGARVLLRACIYGVQERIVFI